MKYLKKFNEEIFDIFGTKKKEREREEYKKSRFDRDHQLAATASASLKKIEDISSNSNELKEIKDIILSGGVKKVKITDGYWPKIKVLLENDRVIEIKRTSLNSYGDSYQGYAAMLITCFLSITDKTFDKIREEQLPIIKSMEIPGMSFRDRFIGEENGIIVSEENFNDIKEYLSNWLKDKESQYKL